MLSYREERLKAIAEAAAAAEAAEKAAEEKRKALEAKADEEDTIDLTGEIAEITEDLNEEILAINDAMIKKINPEIAALEETKQKEEIEKQKKRGRPLGSGKSMLILPREDLSEEDRLEFNLRVTVKTGAELSILEDTEFMGEFQGKVSVICMDKPWGCMKNKKGKGMYNCIDTVHSSVCIRIE